jgi:predicted nucleic acid-binding protein
MPPGAGAPIVTAAPPGYNCGTGVAMKVFLDTNVLIAASIRQHPHFERADAVLVRCSTREDEGVIHAHSLLEFHSAASQLPKGLAVPSAHINTLLDEGILQFVRCVALSAREIRRVQKRAGELGLVGGIVYDLFHLAVAEKENVDRLYTFNAADFRSLAEGDFAERIVVP